jgi:hypothetical protein
VGLFLQVFPQDPLFLLDQVFPLDLSHLEDLLTLVYHLVLVFLLYLVYLVGRVVPVVHVLEADIFVVGGTSVAEEEAIYQAVDKLPAHWYIGGPGVEVLPRIPKDLGHIS